MYICIVRQGMYVKRNIEAHSCNNYCSGKSISVTYSNYVFVALVIHLKFSIPKCYNIQITIQRRSINTTFILYTKVYMSGPHVST